jgi:arylsulfatase A-like enzyme
VRRPGVPAAVLAAALAAGVAAGCRPPAPAVPPRHVVLISLDTFRADGLGGLRPGRESLTPALDRLAADAVLVEGAVAPMAFTLPSHMSMLTGLHPVVHGVDTERDQLGGGVPVLAEAMRGAGYRTVGWITNEWLKPEFGFGRGFDLYERLPHKLTYADRVSQAGLEALVAAESAGRPLFLFLHYMDPHSDFPFGDNRLPYYAPPPYRQHLVADLADPRFCDHAERCSTAFLEAADRERRPLPAAEVDLLHALYEAGLRYVDDELGKLFDALRARGLYDRALVVVVSDHGEEFREHGLFLHSQTYEESLAVPLLVKLPGNRRGGTRVRALVEVADLYPTILEVAGLPVPPGIQGRSLLPLLLSGGPDESWRGRAALGQDKLVRSRFSLRAGRWKLVADVREGKGKPPELYDLLKDPGERRNLAAEAPEQVAWLAGRLKQTLRLYRRQNRDLAAAGGGGEGTVLTDEERERLKSLGYLR